jgi:uncharacterized protein
MQINEEQNLSRKDKVKRAVYLVVGTVSLGLACVGIVLPLLPTTPFLLLSAACYLKSSKRMHNWLLNHKLFGQYIKNYLEGKGISLRAKAISLAFLWTTICFSALLLMPLLIVQVILLVVGVAVTVHIILMPTFKR